MRFTAEWLDRHQARRAAAEQQPAPRRPRAQRWASNETQDHMALGEHLRLFALPGLDQALALLNTWGALKPAGSKGMST